MKKQLLAFKLITFEDLHKDYEKKILIFNLIKMN